jgi:hypothetical protein
METWIMKNEKMLKEEQNEPVCMDEINCYFLFIDCCQNIIKINKECVSLEVCETNSVLRKEELLNMIQQQKSNMCNGTYSYTHALSYLFDFDHEEIEHNLTNGKDFECSLKKIALMDDIIINPSIYIFHDLNCLYFIFEETAKKMKSILKIHDLQKVIPSKRVTIKLSKNKASKTRKNVL